jgi:hypothetical protein
LSSSLSDFSPHDSNIVSCFNIRQIAMPASGLGDVAQGRLASWRLTMLLCAALSCCGCTKTVRVTEDFPSPVVETLPLRVGLRYQESLLNYVHQDTAAGGSGWEIDLGASNERLFERVFATLFESVIRFDGAQVSPAGASRLDLIIEPRLDSYTLEEPAQSGLEFYYVSILYLLNFFSPQGELIGAWPVEGYGRSRAGWVRTNDAIRKATTLAMRDAAARVALELVDTAAIQQVLNASTATVTGTSDAGTR